MSAVRRTGTYFHSDATGFGQTGPNADRAGYDFLIQAMGGIMSVTGPAGGEPTKVGVGIADVMCGMYAAVAILAALNHRDKHGSGQHIDLSLFDSQVAWLINAGLCYLTSGDVPGRMGNAHPNIVPYELFPTSDGYIALAVGNDEQFRRFCTFAGAAALAGDERYASNDSRVRNRERLVPELRRLTAAHPTDYWVDGLRGVGVPCGPVNDIEQVFSDPQLQHRDMIVSLAHPLAAGGDVRLIGNPIKLSEPRSVTAGLHRHSDSIRTKCSRGFWGSVPRTSRHCRRKASCRYTVALIDISSDNGE